MSVIPDRDMPTVTPCEVPDDEIPAHACASFRHHFAGLRETCSSIVGYGGSCWSANTTAEQPTDF
jgi:hypothetical protein